MERNYGDFTGMNKWEVEKQMGKEEFMKLRRGWDYPIPNGESLKDVYDRVIPYYKENILPKLKGGKNIIVSSSGNALRSLVKYLEEVSDEDISKVEIAPGEVYVYQIDEDGNVVSKEIRNQQENRV
jgi:2,3-bisphosphoglycerate-dependent phosphoglycerate mutase